MCRPLTDSRCVSPLRRIASASSWLDGILVAGHEGDGDPGLAALPAGREYAAPSLCADRIEPAARRRAGPARPAPATCRPRRSPGTRHRARNHRSRAAPSAAAAPAGRAAELPRLDASPAGALSSIDRYPDPRRQRRVAWRQGQADRALARRWLDPFDLASSDAIDWPLEPRRRHPLGPRPDQAAAQRRGKREPAERSSRSAPARAQSRQAPRPAARHRNAAHSSGRAEREPRGDAAAEADHEPRRKLRALRLEEPLKPPREPRKSAPSNSPEHAVEEALPYVRGARPLHCSMKRRGKRA